MAKRAFDLATAAALLIVLSPLVALISLWVRLDSPGPVLFRQERVGHGGRPFVIYKFRTMVKDAHCLGPQVTASADPRITRSGRFLRKYKLDETPQLLNVLHGDMSFVGPRPEVPAYVRYWSDEDRRIILSVRPGITDPASIKFRDEELLLAAAPDRERFYIETILPEKLALYREYVQTRSLIGDLALMVQTLVRVVVRDQGEL